MPDPDGARAWLDRLLDPGWDELFAHVVSTDPLSFPGYAEQLEEARARTGESESILVGAGAIDGSPVVVVSFEFGFLGGSMGVAAGERVCRAFERAAESAVPLVALTATGGARMQEGMLALAQMPATLISRARLADAHQPFVAYLRHPTTGGVFASFASSADLVWAEPGATIGFAGPRIAEAVTRQPLPEASHTAEGAEAAGLVDHVLEPRHLRRALTSLLELLAARPHASRAEPPPELPRVERSAWQQVKVARDPLRPWGYQGPLVPLRAVGADDTVTAGLARLAGRPVVAIVQGTAERTPRITPAGYLVARRAIQVATRLGLPVVTLLDTPGADPSADAERAGIARAISETMEALLGAPVPTVACVVGEGGSGGALALGVCDRLLIQENAVFSVIAPEAAAQILKRDDVESVASALRPTAHDLRDVGLADAVVGEPNGGAAEDPAAARTSLEAAIAWALDDIAAAGGAPTEQRRARWRAAGGTA